MVATERDEKGRINWMGVVVGIAFSLSLVLIGVGLVWIMTVLTKGM